MIALDTNVLVRYLAGDDVDQFNMATDWINSCTIDQAGYVCREVMIYRPSKPASGLTGWKLHRQNL